MTTIKKIILKGRGIVAELAGGGDASHPVENSVGSAQIEDESIQKEDLDKAIQDKLDMLDEANVISEEDLESDWQDAMSQAGSATPSQDSESVTDEELEEDWNAAINEVMQQNENQDSGSDSTGE